MTETRKKRLANDYRELMSMEGPYLSVRPISGRAPYYDEYELTIHIRTIIGPEPTYRNDHVALLSFPAGYPTKDYPKLTMVTKPYAFHPNCFKSGAWCYGSASHFTEGIGNFIVRYMQTLQYVSHMIDVTSPANLDAANWYEQNKHNTGYFPCDTSKLPQPVVGGMIIKKLKK